MVTKARLTAQDLWRLGEGDIRRELIHGEVIEMAPVGGVHGRFTLKIGRKLAEHVERFGGGEVVVGDVGFVLNLPTDPERVRAPDVAFISSPRLPGGRLPEGFLPRAPDLAVEVLSPTDNPVEVQQQAKTVTLYRADGRRVSSEKRITLMERMPCLGSPSPWRTCSHNASRRATHHHPRVLPFA